MQTVFPVSKNVDDYTVEITLESANAAFLSNMYTCILPKHILEGEIPENGAMMTSIALRLVQVSTNL